MRVHLLDFDDVYKSLSEAQHYDALWNRFIQILTGSGVDLISYHHITPHIAQDNHGVDILSHGPPRAWLRHYREQKLYIHDPILNLSYQALRPVKWSDITNHRDLTPEQTAFMSKFKEWMKGDGYSIPAFGPSGKTACFGIGNTATIAEWDKPALRLLEWICHQFHLSYSLLRLKEFPESLSLTDQDRDVLQQWGQGAHVITIAEGLGEEAKTIQNIIYKIMEKINVTDSQSLMVRATHLGLIRPNT